MALINCPECGREISDTAKACPNCGFKIKKKSSNIKIFILIIACCIIIGSIFLLLSIKKTIFHDLYIGMTREEARQIYGVPDKEDSHFDNYYCTINGVKGTLSLQFEYEKKLLGATWVMDIQPGKSLGYYDKDINNVVKYMNKHFSAITQTPADTDWSTDTALITLEHYRQGDIIKSIILRYEQYK